MIYAETFHVPPQEVEHTTQIVWWERWRLWLQTQRSRRLHETWRASGGKATRKWTDSDRADYFWAMKPDG